MTDPNSSSFDLSDVQRPSGAAETGDIDLQALAQAERDAGVPDRQTALAAAQAKDRQGGPEAESEAHPS